jgi:hypothetical protein
MARQIARKTARNTVRKKGGAAGANQGGASRGSSRLEPSHLKKSIKTDKAGGRGKGAKASGGRPGGPTGSVRKR